ncbi:MAG TPA: DNA polymerase Y family protein [Myxococcota bacterium]|nr:DNA polymerase Y family protein [Myxococcota bacterium]
MRIACLLAANLPLAAVLRAQPELAGLPLAIVSSGGPRAQVIAISSEAARAGVRPSFSVVHNRSICPALRVRMASPALERTACETLLDVARTFSPRVAAAPRCSGVYAAEAAVYLDASGVGSLFRSEEGFAAALTRRACSTGIPAVASVTSSRGVSLLAARCIARGLPQQVQDAQSAAERCRAGTVLVLAPGEEATFLDPLPVDLLDPEDVLAEALTRFGIRRVGELTRLPRRSLVTRLGPGVLRLLALANGEKDTVPLPHTAETRVEEGMDLEWPIENLESLSFVLRGLVARLAERLELRGLVCGDLDLELRLSGGGCDTRRVGVSAPHGDPRSLLGVLRLALEHPLPRAPVEAIVLATEGRPARTDQLDLFRPAGPTPSALGRTLAELEALCGSERIGTPLLVDDPHPDAFAQSPFSLPCSALKTAPRPGTAIAALRTLRPPLPAEVRAPRGRPEWIRSAVANGPIVGLAGPWRTTGGWWSPERRFAFDSFDARTEDGNVIRLRFDLVQRVWQVDAIYD